MYNNIITVLSIYGRSGAVNIMIREIIKLHIFSYVSINCNHIKLLRHLHFCSCKPHPREASVNCN